MVEALLPAIREVDTTLPDAADRLAARLPLDGPELSRLRVALRAAVESKVVADRENDGVRFSRLRKAADDADYSIDVVHMNKPALAHTHPRGEVDLCFAVEGDARFDDQPEGWTVYPPGSWHVPTVTGGAMDILYFLPGGAITFGPRQ